MKQANEWPVLVWMHATKQSGRRLQRMGYIRHALVVLLMLASVLVAAGCTPTRQTRTAPLLGRADPGHLHWLERQSMLGAAPALLREVSASQRLWGFSVAPSRPEPLLAGSALWLTISPQTYVTPAGHSLLRDVATPSSMALWRALGLGGLFVEHGLESGRAWFPGRPATWPDDDATSLQLASDVGTEDEWNTLMARGLENGLQLGADLPGFFTGYGPDFTLATSGLRDWPGAYLMLEIPRDFWHLLPPAPAEGPGVPLSASSVAQLSAEKLFPALLARDQVASAPLWAATGEIRGYDGALRRWIYRFHGEPHKPVLYADDPSHAARRLVSAAIIQETGLRRTPLARLHAKAAHDLIREGERAEDVPPVVDSLAREIRRYGGWSLSTENWPLPRSAQDGGPDFVLDTVTWPALEWAVLRGDARPLGAALDAAIHVDQRRLWRPLSFEKPLDFTPFGGPVLQSTLPGLAAMRCGLLEQEQTAPSAESLRRVQALHELALRVRASLPGIVAGAGADLTGLVYVTPHESASTQNASRVFPAWDTGSASHASASQRGVARGRTLYPSLLQQMTQGTHAVQALRQMATLRATYRLAEGVVQERLATGHPGVVAWTTALPGTTSTNPSGGLLLTVANFSDTVQKAHLTLPHKGQGRDLLDPALPPLSPLSPGARVVSVELPPFGCRLVLYPVSAP